MVTATREMNASEMNLAAGFRASLTLMVPATASLITHSPFGGFAALGGLYTAIADTGGLYRSRALVMGAVSWALRCSWSARSRAFIQHQLCCLPPCLHLAAHICKRSDRLAEQREIRSSSCSFPQEGRSGYRWATRPPDGLDGVEEYTSQRDYGVGFLSEAFRVAF
jgi:hypothetical protein